MAISTETIAVGAAMVMAVAIIVLAIRLWSVERRINVFLQGGKTPTLESVLALLRNEAMEARKAITLLDAHTKNMEERVRRSAQHVGIVRFNPFRDSGGDQSFALAVLDEGHNGVVISSLYARDGVRVYGKPVRGGVSSYQLTAEETQAIQEATHES